MCMTATPTSFEAGSRNASARRAVLDAWARVQRLSSTDVLDIGATVPSADVAAIAVQIERDLGCAAFPPDVFDAPNSKDHPALCYDATDTFRIGRLVQIVDDHLTSTGWQGPQ